MPTLNKVSCILYNRRKRHANVSKQATLLDRLDIRLLKWFVHEGMNDISNVKVHLKTRIGNVNLRK